MGVALGVTFLLSNHCFLAIYITGILVLFAHLKAFSRESSPNKNVAPGIEWWPLYSEANSESVLKAVFLPLSWWRQFLPNCFNTHLLLQFLPNCNFYSYASYWQQASNVSRKNLNLFNLALTTRNKQNLDISGFCLSAPVESRLIHFYESCL